VERRGIIEAVEGDRGHDRSAGDVPTAGRAPALAMSNVEQIRRRWNGRVLVRDADTPIHEPILR
jgi:hypothetical protein